MAKRISKLKKAAKADASTILTVAEAAGRTVGRAVEATMAAVEGVVARATRKRGRAATSKAGTKRRRKNRSSSH